MLCSVLCTHDDHTHEFVMNEIYCVYFLLIFNTIQSLYKFIIETTCISSSNRCSYYYNITPIDKIIIQQWSKLRSSRIWVRVNTSIVGCNFFACSKTWFMILWLDGTLRISSSKLVVEQPIAKILIVFLSSLCFLKRSDWVCKNCCWALYSLVVVSNITIRLYYKNNDFNQTIRDE